MSGGTMAVEAVVHPPRDSGLKPVTIIRAEADDGETRWALAGNNVNPWLGHVEAYRQAIHLAGWPGGFDG